LLKRKDKSCSGLRFTVVFLLAVIAVFALLTACGGDDEGGDTGDSETPTATEEGDGGEEGETPTEDAGNGSGGSFSDRAQDYEAVSGKTTYTLSSTGSEDQTWTIYSEGSNSRIDITADDGTVTTIIQTADASYLCSEDTCVESPAAAGSLADAFIGLFGTSAISAAAANIADADVDSFDEEIAGEDAKCFKVTGETVAGQGAGDATWCFADDGLLLRALFEGGGVTTGFEATEVSRDVSDADFEPPYDVIDIPGT